MATEDASSPSGSLTSEELAAIEDEDVLNKMLDNAKDFEERRMIRAALRDLLRRKIDKRKEERGAQQADLKQQGVSRAGPTGGAVNQRPSTHIQGSSSAFTPFNRTVASKTSPSVASPQKCPATAAPNAKNVKQMLLDWCRAKTEPYEGVNIQNFSSSWKDGIAFCALVHRFFPDAFEYSILNPNKPRDNFQLAFSTAERLAGCPPLLDADDLVRMKEPDWKCVYTYIQEFYRCLAEKGLVKTKKRP